MPDFITNSANGKTIENENQSLDNGKLSKPSKLSELSSYDKLTTGQVANICGVSQQTVIRWCRLEKIKSHKIPSSTHRRIFAKDVREFLIENGTPFE